jgi:transcription initiation factor IIF auxiliary subunit
MSPVSTLNLELAQDETYQGEDWWRWSVRVEGDPESLDQIARVVYQLHPTFPQPVREVTDRETNFAVKSEGWGTFVIHARVELQDGRSQKLSHELQLTYPDGTVTLA